MKINKSVLVTLSFSHLSTEDLDLLKEAVYRLNSCIRSSGRWVIQLWWLNPGQDEDWELNVVEYKKLGLSDDFIKLLSILRAESIDYVEFDPDGEIVEELPTYEHL